MTTMVIRSKVAAPALAALLALSCGRSLTLDDRPGSNGGAGGSSSPGTSDGGDATSAGGASGAAGSGTGGSTGAGGTVVPPDGGADKPKIPDAGKDVADAGPPDVPPDHSPTPDVGGCPVDCTQLPHVRTDVVVPCINGVCNLYYGTCEPEFAHCSSTPNIGCETDLSMSPNCGGCGVQCSSGYSCRTISNGYNYCLQDCQAPAATACDFSCVDLQNDPSNCGACGNGCYVTNEQVACQQGKCVALGCTDSTVADCTSDPGCETMLGNDPNCGGCNDPACALDNTMYTCSDGLGCKASVCAVGYANCNTSSPDCETAFASPAPAGAGCLPQYVGTVGLATQLLNTTVTAIASDGSFFIAGTYQGAVDFDPSSAGKDVRTANDPDGYITKFKADGSYAWTAILGGRGGLTLTALALTPAGSVVATGSYQDTIDLDPSAAQDIRVTSDTFETDVFVVELSSAGAEVWGRTFPSTAFNTNATSTGLAVDAAGAVYVAGYFSGSIDFDPGAGTDAQTSAIDGSGFLAKLDSAGNHAWAHAIDDADCLTTLRAVAVATDGNVWATGTVAAGPTCVLGPERGTYPVDDALIVKFNSAGDARTVWSLGDIQPDAAVAIAAGRNGGVYIGGIATGDVDLDPGSGVARRWLGAYSGSGFVLALAADGTYQWSRVLSSASIVAMASTPDGGAIVAGSASQAYVTRLTPAGDSVWTFPVGDQSVSATALASSGTSFAVGGISSGTQDFDPGPSIDLVFGDVAFVSRFNF